MNQRPVVLLKHGQPVTYVYCRRCDQLVRALSELGLCSTCELDCQRSVEFPRSAS